MALKERLDILLPRALQASRKDQVLRLVSPMLPFIWREIPKDKPIQIQCALAERKLLRKVPLGLCAGEMLAGSLDVDAADAKCDDLEWCVPFPGGQVAHTALDSEKLLRLGISGIESKIKEHMTSTSDESAHEFYRSALISLEGFKDLAARFRQMAEQLSQKAANPAAASEMRRLADALNRVPNEPASTFYEAIQATHLLYFAAAVTVQSLYGPGRMDRCLFPYYKADLELGRITREEALELICCQFILMNHLFNLPQPVIIGGLGKDGHDTTNDLTYLCLEAEELVGLVNPALAIGVNDETPQEILDTSTKLLLSGRTKPALFGDKTIIAGLEARGVPYEDAIGYVQSTCVEITLSGMSNILVASPYINLLKPLEFILNDGKQMFGIENPNDVNSFTQFQPPALDSYSTFDDLLSEYFRQLGGRIQEAASQMREVRRRRVEGWAYPLVSCFTDDCIKRGLDVDRGGARYNWTETSCVGLANITDSLMVIKQKVFEEHSYTLAHIKDMLASDFPDEQARADLVSGVPHYGNDDQKSDKLASEVVKAIYDEHSKYLDYTGGWFVPGFFCYVMYKALGEQSAASPDGRRSCEVLADGSGAAQGRDCNGPTAAIRSITAWDHKPGLGGIVLNLRFSPESFGTQASRYKLADLLRTYFDLGGFEVQVNAVNDSVLRAAQKNPENYADILVRVAGYSNYFTLLDRVMQEEVISRTQHC